MGPFINIHRHPERSVKDMETAYSIVDQSLLAYVAFTHEGTVFNIPMAFVRIENYLYFHSSKQGRFYNVLKSGCNVCAEITIIDGIVLAKSAFNTSMRYRSVAVFNSMEEVSVHSEKLRISEALAEKMVPGRWKDCRHPSPEEISATGFLKLSMDVISVKVNTSGPNEKVGDKDLPYWSGIIKLHTVMDAEPVSSGTELPDYIVNHIKSNQ
ncbi:MAG: pyridoxamine 5'-phosphate oxidase family protein [Ferroplasma sp.]|uniref:pyridoxamine 5'-phosphate oxidase family protein n=1 Tax=Ferroplasma sp. TaxID=2591003 RepID=UPI00281631FA|nr:pyridoxamine 5'-phosphate oxidase family protein [Ferroplasma sp.]WMT50568.1 MAG: pyridoxamine 5'-phosphate oxidase family protein [Ferroplasma sp.]